MTLLRMIMIIRNPEQYFGQAWGQSWDVITKNNVAILDQYGIDMAKFQKALDFEIV